MLHDRKISVHLLAACAAICLTIPALAAGQQTKVIYTFQGSAASNQQGGEAPEALIADEAGNLYGVTAGGGSCLVTRDDLTCGIAFELSPPTSAGGSWTETQLFDFSQVLSGSNPIGNLVRDKEGNLYGVSEGYSLGTGGSCGEFYELSPPSQAGEAWTFTNLYYFGGNTDGCAPAGTLVADSRGNIYGVLTSGGYPPSGHGAPPKGYGTGGVFKLTPPPSEGGTWTESFSGNIDPQYYQNGGIVLDGTNGLYMTLGPSVYEVFPPGDAQGKWSWKLIYTFQPSDNQTYPLSLTVDNHGNVYGVTQFGGTANEGTVFELSESEGTWTETTLYSFQSGSDGAQPLAQPTLDKAGNVYGTTAGGGSPACGLPGGCGTVYELTNTGDGWTEKVLQVFDGSNGSYLTSPVLLIGQKIYGTTVEGGADDYGLAFEIN
jgi:uncharacterized repeat protein (TIGR03803 family)